MKTPTHGHSSFLLLAALLSFSLWSPGARAQYPADDDFNPPLNPEVHALAVQADGKILVGGPGGWFAAPPPSDDYEYFEQYVFQLWELGRLLADGSPDTGFQADYSNQWGGSNTQRCVRWRCRLTARYWWAACSTRWAANRAAGLAG